jgi:hypothetical protein
MGSDRRLLLSTVDRWSSVYGSYIRVADKKISAKFKVPSAGPLFQAGCLAKLTFVSLFLPKPEKQDMLYVGPFQILWRKQKFFFILLSTHLTRVHLIIESCLYKARMHVEKVTM